MGVYKLSGAGGLLTPRVNYTSMLAGNEAFVVPGDYELIETHILATAAPSVTFSSLATHASTYKHLQIRAVAKSSSINSNAFLRFNGVSTSSYAYHDLFGGGSSVGSGNATSQTQIKNVVNLPPTHFSASVIDILDAFSSTKNKTIRRLGGFNDSASVLQIALISGLFISTDSITSLTITGNQNLAIGSRFSLYGIRG